MKEEDVPKLKVAELKEELRSRELSVTGLKAELAKRLLEAVRNEAQEEKAADAKDAPAEEKEEGAAGPFEGSKEDVEGQQPAGKTDGSQVPADAAQQEPKKQASTKQAQQASTVTLDTEAKDADRDPKTEQPASAPSDGKPEAPAAPAVQDPKPEAPAPTAVSDKKPDRKVNIEAKESSTGTAADTSVAKSSDVAKEPEADKHAIKHLAGDTGHALRMPRKEQLKEEPAATPVQPAAPPQAAADDSAAPQVDVLGSVEVAAPLQETVEEELDYEADEDMEQASAPASTKAEVKPDEASRKKRPADSERGRSSKAQRTDESERRKREPIAFKPRDSAGSGSGRLAENGQREGPADLKRTGSQSEKRSVFERLHSGSGKEATTPRRAPPSREAASRALLITGFVRPFTEPMARQMLSETGEIKGFWMPKIKDRAYIIYATEEEAEATRNAISGIEWPTGNANSLRPKFVSLDDAERTIKTGQPPEMRMEVSATATAPQPAKAAVAAAAAAAEPARAAPARPGAPQQNGPAAEPSKPKDMREILEERRRARDAKKTPAAVSPADAQPKPAASQPVVEPEPMDEEEPEPKALEELFRKTETKPWLYWLPLTEEQVAEKATRDAAQLPGPPAKPVRQ